jgi:hypothetical protein
VWVQLETKQATMEYMEALRDITEGAPDGIFSNMFCQVLFAQQAAIDTLMTTVMTLLEGGAIRSYNYAHGIDGFEIDSNGNAEFNSVHIAGNSVFAGDIVSGPLELNNRNSASPIEIKNWVQGDFTQEFYDYVVNKGNLGKTVPTNGTYGSIPFVFYGTFLIGKDTWNFSIYDKDMNILAVNGITQFSLKSPVYSPPSQWAPKFVYGNFQIGFYNPSGRTFKLNNLPLNEPDYKGAIWQDAAGYLRIKK